MTRIRIDMAVVTEAGAAVLAAKGNRCIPGNHFMMKVHRRLQSELIELRDYKVLGCKMRKLEENVLHCAGMLDSHVALEKEAYTWEFVRH